jgi:hypothetical protein
MEMERYELEMHSCIRDLCLFFWPKPMHVIIFSKYFSKTESKASTFTMYPSGRHYHFSLPPWTTSFAIIKPSSYFLHSNFKHHVLANITLSAWALVKSLEKKETAATLISCGEEWLIPSWLILVMVFRPFLMLAARCKNLVFLYFTLNQFYLDFCLHIASTTFIHLSIVIPKLSLIFRKLIEN